MEERRHTFAGGFALRELVTLALVAALIVMSKSLFRVSIHVPGHSGFLWMALLVIARGVVRKPWAGTLVGEVSGILAVEGLMLRHVNMPIGSSLLALAHKPR